MARLIVLEATKTYATAANAVKAVEKKYPSTDDDNLRYILQRTEDGRYFPVFFGQSAIDTHVYFNFHVAA